MCKTIGIVGTTGSMPRIKQEHHEYDIVYL